MAITLLLHNNTIALRYFPINHLNNITACLFYSDDPGHPYIAGYQLSVSLFTSYYDK